MKLIYVLSVTLVVNAFLATSLNVKRPKRNLLWVKNLMANFFGYKRPLADHSIVYTVPEYLIFQPATIAPQYMNQNIYQGPLTKILIPCYMQNQPFITFEQQNIPLYIYNTDECNYRTILNSDYLNINGPQYSPYPLKYYDQIQNPEAIRSEKQTYSRNMEPLQEKFNKKLSHCTEDAKPTVPKIQNYQEEEQIRNIAGSTKAPELTVTKNNFESLSTSTTIAISTTSVASTTSVTSTTPVTPTTSMTSTTPVTLTTSATFTSSAPTTISAISTTSATSINSVPSTTSVASPTSTTFTNLATSTILATDTPLATSTISSTSDASTISATSIENLASITFSTLDKNSTQTPPVTTTDTTTPSTTDSATTTFSTSTLTSTTIPIVNTIDTLPASEITVIPESSIRMQLNSSTDSSSSTSVSFETTTFTSLAQADSTTKTELGNTKELPIFTNSLETTTLSNIIRNESDFKNATNGMTNPLGITELNDQISTGSSFHRGENNNTEETTIAVPLNSNQESNFPLGKSEEGLLPHEKKENFRGDIPDMTV